ncbi:MAG: hypothetical protein JKY19_00780 [Alcanivoracaceae bacterium]|nr:hypothetical protein [Alcanivoracaceae bacterium]
MNKKDLTRWNRAGKSQFQYIDGNAITYLETLRQTLHQQFNNGSPQWDELVSRFPELFNESLFQKNKRISEQYYDERRDFAWEILRAFSRSVHVLGEYINAYANEAYLPTAVEWDNVRKLVALLGYQPSPPSSAITPIALLLKQGLSGEVKRGFAIKNKPAKGESTIIFETLEKLKGNSLLNTIHLKDWNQNKRTLKKHNNQNKEVNFELPYLAKDINVGDLGILAMATSGFTVEVLSITNNQDYSIIRLQSSQNLPNSLTLIDTTLYLQPRFIDTPLPNGSGSATLSQTVNLSVGEILIAGKNNNLVALEIAEIEQNKVLFKQTNFTNNDDIIRAQVSIRQNITGFLPSANGSADYFILNNITNSNNVLMVDESLSVINVSISSTPTPTPPTNYLDGAALSGDKLFYIQRPLASTPIATITDVGSNTVTNLQFTGKATELNSDQWAWVDHKVGSPAAYLISEIKQKKDQFSLSLINPSTGIKSTQSVSSIQSGYKQTLKHKDFEINNEPAWSTGSTNSATVFELEDPGLLALLKIGQKLIFSSNEKSINVEIRKIENQRLHVTPPFHLDYNTGIKTHVFSRNNTVIHGNVVNASHGENQPQVILGNGDASQTGQNFKLASDHISWLNDPSFNTGVRADTLLIVGNRYWQQVENLSNSGAEDHHYQIKIDEDNKLSVHFGDGRHGRKLPTGIDNIRVNFREGNGEAGNLKPYSLIKITRPDPLVDDFIAPLAATGGAMKEDPNHMRENAPAALLTLNRAVSLRDFEHLARHHSMVWQAKAFEKMANRPAPALIEIIIVSAGGSVFAANSEVARTLKGFFSQHAIPNLPISVLSYQPLLMRIQPTIMVDESAFDKDQVARAVKQHLQAALSLKQRQLGQALFRNSIIALIEQVEGVENANCEIIASYFPATKSLNQAQTFKGVDGEIRKITIKPNQLLYLDTDIFPLNIISKTFEI